jgi:DNA (cytosine-5)-methyltransferase 1
MLNGLALFAGYGGLELGIDAAFNGVRTVGYVERESYAAAALVARMEEQTLDQASIWDDVTTFDGRPWRGVVDIISAGFPCQPFSVAGNQRGTHDERWLWEDIERIICEVQPKWFIGENVTGLVPHGLGAVLGSFASLGYYVSWGTFRADQMGASHRRERVFLLAQRGNGLDHTNGQPERRPDASICSGRDTFAIAKHDLAHTRRQRTQIQTHRRQPTIEKLGTTRTIFAPGPANLDLWAGVLAESPTLEPSVCRVANGATERLDYRQDRLRACGNGVVPLQAAVAVRVLADRAGWQLK